MITLPIKTPPYKRKLFGCFVASEQIRSVQFSSDPFPPRKHGRLSGMVPMLTVLLVAHGFRLGAGAGAGAVEVFGPPPIESSISADNDMIISDSDRSAEEHFGPTYGGGGAYDDTWSNLDPTGNFPPESGGWLIGTGNGTNGTTGNVTRCTGNGPDCVRCVIAPCNQTILHYIFVRERASTCGCAASMLPPLPPPLDPPSIAMC